MVLKQVFIINSDLKMSEGETAVQVAHGEVYYMERLIYNIRDPLVSSRYRVWRDEQDELMKKIVLKATELEMTQLTWKLKDKVWAYPVFDRGLTQAQKSICTCLVVEPLSEQECDKLFSHLKPL